MSLGDLTKLPAMIFAWETLQEVSMMLVVVVVVFLTGGLYVSGLLFHATGTPPWLLRSVKASASSELYPGYFRLLCFCQAFPSQFYRERYGFERTFFTHRRFFTLQSFPTFLARFVTQMRAETPHPGSSSVPALTELSLPADAWTLNLFLYADN